MPPKRGTQTCQRCGRSSAGDLCNSCRYIPEGMVSSAEVLMILGITYRQLDYWSTNLLERRVGSGHQRLFSMDDLMTLANIYVLTELGLKPVDAMTHLNMTVISGIDSEIHVNLDQLRKDLETSLRNREALQKTVVARDEMAGADQ